VKGRRVGKKARKDNHDHKTSGADEAEAQVDAYSLVTITITIVTDLESHTCKGSLNTILKEEEEYLQVHWVCAITYMKAAQLSLPTSIACNANY
jgi:hypothetical protein